QRVGHRVADEQRLVARREPRAAFAGAPAALEGVEAPEVDLGGAREGRTGPLRHDAERGTRGTEVPEVAPLSARGRGKVFGMRGEERAGQQLGEHVAAELERQPATLEL